MEGECSTHGGGASKLVIFVSFMFIKCPLYCVPFVLIFQFLCFYFRFGRSLFYLGF